MEEVSLTLVRRLQAPVARAFAAWTDPGLMQRWFGPGALCARAVLDARPGGRYRVEMRHPDGSLRIVGGEFLELLPNRRIVKTWQWEGSEEVTRVTIDFRELGPDQTEITLTHARFGQAQTRDLHVHGWTDSLRKLVGLFEVLQSTQGDGT